MISAGPLKATKRNEYLTHPEKQLNTGIQGFGNYRTRVRGILPEPVVSVNEAHVRQTSGHVKYEGCDFIRVSFPLRCSSGRLSAASHLTRQVP
jgi:hypothetical protein